MVDLRVRTDRGGMSWNFGPNEFLDYLEQSDEFENVVGVDDGSAHLLAEGIAENIEVVRATPELFTYLGVQPAHGRHFGPPDVDPGAPLVAVLNHRTWTRLFGSDPAVVGRANSPQL